MYWGEILEFWRQIKLCLNLSFATYLCSTWSGLFNFSEDQFFFINMEKLAFVLEACFEVKHFI